MLKTKQKKQIESWVQQALGIYRLKHFTIRVKYFPDYSPENPVEFMDISTDHTYLKALMRVNEKVATKEWTEWGEKVMRKHVFHEVAHIIMEEFDEVARDRFSTKKQIADANEKVTELFSKIVNDLV